MLWNSLCLDLACILISDTAASCRRLRFATQVDSSIFDREMLFKVRLEPRPSRLFRTSPLTAVHQPVFTTNYCLIRPPPPRCLVHFTGGSTKLQREISSTENSRSPPVQSVSGLKTKNTGIQKLVAPSIAKNKSNWVFSYSADGTDRQCFRNDF